MATPNKKKTAPTSSKREKGLKEQKNFDKAEEKKTPPKESKKNQQKETAKESQREPRRRREPRGIDSPFHQIMPIFLTALAALTGVCIYAPKAEMGVFGEIIHDACFGFLGGGAFLIPALLLITAIFWRANVRAGLLYRRLVFAVALILIVSVFSYTFGMPTEMMRKVGRFFSLGTDGEGGGLIGGLVGCLFYLILSRIGSFIVFFTLLIVAFIYAYGSAAKIIFTRTLNALKLRLNERREKRLAEEEARAAIEARRQSERQPRDEAMFYDSKLGGAKDDVTTDLVAASMSDGSEKNVTRRFYDMERGGAEKKTVAPLSSDSAASYNSEERSALTKNASFDVVEDTHKETSSRNSGEISEESEISIVSNRPIPPNRANPFSKEKTLQQDAQNKNPSGIEVEKSSVKPMDEQCAESANESTIPVSDGSDTASVNDSAASKKNEGSHSLVINKAHVVEHIGAETFASEEDAKEDEKFFYSFPPLSLLQEDSDFNQEDSDLEIEAKADKLRETLRNFGVAADITCVSRGPRLTRYELVPQPGVRISKIENLVDEITMNLEAISVRIEAPIPGKAAIGVEVPNINTTTVRLRGLLDTDTFRDAPGKTTVCLGVDVIGKPVFADLDKMPHLLVAGATGMGKSVCINSLLVSLLYKARPDEVKLILIDPKKVEFQSYANIPHLLVPVVTEPQKAAGALAWAVSEMERRYDLIESAAVRNIVSYNKTVDDHPGRVKMPQIVVVIDELHDLMLQAREAVEDSIARIAAKARAAGILLIIGTQRPSVNVITGVIKANIPSRIAFHVASQVDSRTILDAVGAEKLLNNGDMLFLSPGMKMMTPKRIQGAFLDDDEVNRVADYLRKNSSAVVYDEAVMADMERESEKCNKDKKQGGDFGPAENGADMAEEELFYKAVEIALENDKISTSLLQRRLSLGFGKAARLIDRMEAMNIVGRANGQKPREVLITADEYRAMRLRNDE